MIDIFIGVYEFFTAIAGGLVCYFFASIFFVMYFSFFAWVVAKCIGIINLLPIKLSKNNSYNTLLVSVIYLALVIGWFGLALYSLKFDYNPLTFAMDSLPKGTPCNR